MIQYSFGGDQCAKYGAGSGDVSTPSSSKARQAGATAASGRGRGGAFEESRLGTSIYVLY